MEIPNTTLIYQYTPHIHTPKNRITKHLDEGYSTANIDQQIGHGIRVPLVDHKGSLTVFILEDFVTNGSAEKVAPRHERLYFINLVNLQAKALAEALVVV